MFYLSFDALYWQVEAIEQKLAPQEGDPRRVLDVGSGNGIW